MINANFQKPNRLPAEASKMPLIDLQVVMEFIELWDTLAMFLEPSEPLVRGSMWANARSTRVSLHPRARGNQKRRDHEEPPSHADKR